MISGNDGGATISFDGGSNWSSIMNQPTAQFYHVAIDDQLEPPSKLIVAPPSLPLIMRRRRPGSPQRVRVAVRQSQPRERAAAVRRFPRRQVVGDARCWCRAGQR